MNTRYKQIIADCEDFLEKYGDTHKGVGWLKDQDVDHRYRIMLESIKPGLRGNVWVDISISG